MHIKPMKDSDGVFSEWEIAKRSCPECGKQAVRVREWNSHCGGYTDYQYKCQSCGHIWWIDGIDA